MAGKIKELFNKGLDKVAGEKVKVNYMGKPAGSFRMKTQRPGGFKMKYPKE
jgi:hypothetical protein